MGAERHTRTVLKPRLLRAQYEANSQIATWPDVRFNLSHTSGAALVGVVLSREVGIDIEWLRPMEDLDAMARSITSGEELDQWESLDAASRFDAFYRVWTRKESYLKAIGLGLYRSLQDVTVPVLLDDSSGTLWEVRDRAGEGHWSGRDIPVEEGYSASICWEGAEALQLVVRDLDLSGIAGGG